MAEDTADLLARLEREASAPDAVVAYGPEPSQFGELRLPVGTVGDGPYPLVIAIHGGYWRARYDLRYFGAACGALGRVGLATWNIEYRRTGEAGGGWPGTFADVAAAADYARDLAREYPLDLTRVVALGHSAGGQLGLWLAARAKLAAASPLWRSNPVRLAGVVSLAGVVDLRRAWELGLSDGATGLLLDGGPEERPERYADASPYDALPLGARQVLLHGDADTNVPIELSARYAEKARRLGDPVEYAVLSRAGHFDFVDPATPEWRAVEHAVLSLAGARP